MLQGAICLHSKDMLFDVRFISENDYLPNWRLVACIAQYAFFTNVFCKVGFEISVPNVSLCLPLILEAGT